MVRRIHRLGLLPEFGIAGHKDSRHKNDKLSAHELLQKAWLRQNNKVSSRNSGIARGWEKSSGRAYATKLASILEL